MVPMRGFDYSSMQPDAHVLSGSQPSEMQGQVTELDVQRDGRRMRQHLAQHAIAQVPPVAGPDPPDVAAADALAEDGVDAAAHATEPSARARAWVAPCARARAKGPAGRAT